MANKDTTAGACKNPNCTCKLGETCKKGGPFTEPYQLDSGLTANKYQELANRTAKREPVAITPEQSDLLNWTTGLTGEAGEVADLIKKGIFHGQGVDVDKVRRELGDVLWYVAAFCHTLNVPLEQIMLENLEKLRKRFPNGFTNERSTFREEIDAKVSRLSDQAKARIKDRGLTEADLAEGVVIETRDEEDHKWYKIRLETRMIDGFLVTDVDERSCMSGETYKVELEELLDPCVHRKCV